MIKLFITLDCDQKFGENSFLEFNSVLAFIETVVSSLISRNDEIKIVEYPKSFHERLSEKGSKYFQFVED